MEKQTFEKRFYGIWNQLQTVSKEHLKDDIKYQTEQVRLLANDLNKEQQKEPTEKKQSNKQLIIVSGWLIALNGLDTDQYDDTVLEQLNEIDNEIMKSYKQEKL